MDTASRVLAIWLIVNLLALLLWDLLVMLVLKDGLTISWWVWQMANSFPPLWLFIGLAIGHLFLPLRVPKL